MKLLWESLGATKTGQHTTATVCDPLSAKSIGFVQFLSGVVKNYHIGYHRARLGDLAKTALYPAENLKYLISVWSS